VVTDADHASVWSAADAELADLIGETKLFPSTMRCPSRLMRVVAMELFTKLFGDLLLFFTIASTVFVIHGTSAGCHGPNRW